MAEFTDNNNKGLIRSLLWYVYIQYTFILADNAKHYSSSIKSLYNFVVS